MKKFVYSGSPHIRSKTNTRSIMLDVCIALVPAIAVGCVFFGLSALVVVAIAVLACVASEVCFNLIMKKDIEEIFEKFDFTSVVTGLLLGMNLPSNVEWYVPVVGGIVAIVLVKMIFGGTGNNLVNPAIVGRIFIFISFASVAPAEWLVPNMGGTIVATTGATPLTALLTKGIESFDSTMLFNAFIGNVAGCIGETSAAALLMGGIYLSIRRVINPIKPLIYIVTTGLVTVMLFKFDFAYFLPSILTGGLFLGAIFMATDYTTSPKSMVGNIVYFVTLGVLTAVLRFAKGMEVVSFVILLMNLFVPLIDKYIVPKPFGKLKSNVVKEAK